MSTINNRQDIIDSRDVIERINELESEQDDFIEENPGDVWAVECPDEAEEFFALIALQNEAEGYTPDWGYGEILIRDSYFTEYAKELAEDIGAVSREHQWPLNHIDWERAVDELKMDFTCIDFDGVDYWIRCALPRDLHVG